MSQVIVVGGGLAGMSAAHTVVQSGGKVVVLDKSPFCGGNSTKATSGINASMSRSQRALGIEDTHEIFEQDTTVSAAEGARPNLIRTLTHQSGPSVDWLVDSFGLDLSIIARLAAHSNPRTHRGKERFPGMAITYGLMEQLDEIAAQGDKARVINKATVKELIRDGDEVIGVIYEKGGKEYKEYGPVILATGGFGADFSDSSLLNSVSGEFAKMSAWQESSRAGKQNPGGPKKIPMPNLMTLPTTNGPHCSGDGIKLALSAGSDTFDLHCVQIHPTGIVDPQEPDAKVKFLAAEALRGSGGILLDAEGNRFCDELGKRDYVSGRMFVHGKPPYRLCLNGKATKLINWHCDHYRGRGLMKQLTGAELAKEMGVSPDKLQKTFDEYNAGAKAGNDKWGKKFFEALPAEVNDTYHVAIVTPLIHYCMGGIAADENANILTAAGKPIPGLFGAGEVLGGIHGVNRLGGSSLLDCVVYGRVSGKTASTYLLNKLISTGGAGGAGGKVNLSIDPSSNSVTVSWGKGGQQALAGPQAPTDDGNDEVDPNQQFYGTGDKKAAGGDGPKPITMEEVAKHTSNEDCWVILHDQVFDITPFLDDHPGGRKAIMLYAGKDATVEFDMLHKKEIIDKYAMEYFVGPLAKDSKL